MKPFLFTLLIILGSINCYCQKLSENESIQSSSLPIVIDNKTYGICRETGKLIPKERLRAVPHATLSIEAKQNRR